ILMFWVFRKRFHNRCPILNTVLRATILLELHAMTEQIKANIQRYFSIPPDLNFCNPELSGSAKLRKNLLKDGMRLTTEFAHLPFLKLKKAAVNSGLSMYISIM